MTTLQAKMQRAGWPLAQFLGTLVLIVLVTATGAILFDEGRDRARRACERGVENNRVSIGESWAAYNSNTAVSTDPALTALTRRSRKREAAANLRAVHSREERVPRKFRVTPEGRKLDEFDCDSA